MKNVVLYGFGEDDNVVNVDQHKHLKVGCE